MCVCMCVRERGSERARAQGIIEFIPGKGTMNGEVEADLECDI